LAISKNQPLGCDLLDVDLRSACDIGYGEPTPNKRVKPSIRDAVAAVRLVSFTPLGSSLLWQSIAAVAPKFEFRISNSNLEIYV